MSEIKVCQIFHPIGIKIADEKLWVTLEDERVISTPLRWYPWLDEASSEQQNHYELLPDAVYWTDLNEGLEVEGMLRGIRPSPTIDKKLITNN